MAEKCICCEPFRETSLSWHSLPSACETEQGTGRKVGGHPAQGRIFPAWHSFGFPCVGAWCENHTGGLPSVIHP